MSHPQSAPRRARLGNKLVRALPLAPAGQYVVRDTTLPGFFVVVGRRTRTYTIQVDTRRLGRRRTVRETVGRADEWDATDARKEARAQIGALQTGARDATARRGRVTLRAAWASYRDLLERRVAAGERSPRTLDGYTDCVERLLKDWLDTPLSDLSEDAQGVSARHVGITRRHGPYAANHAMRALRAIYRHARKTRMERGLPAENPIDAVVFNAETRRDTGMSQAELGDWHRQLRALPNPVRQEFFLMMLLSGSRPDALKRARWSDLDVARRVLHFPNPKGGEARAFDMPLSGPMLRCLWRARNAGRVMHAAAAERFIFSAGTPTGHIAETKERRDRLAKYGGDLRQTFATAARAAGLGEMDVHILMNHKLGGVSGGYITTGALLGHLIAQQERVSRYLVDGLLAVKI